MGITVLQHINPGDAITSDLINYLIDRVLEFDGRLTKLEAVRPVDAVDISSFEPPVQQAIGQRLAIDGVGFLFPADLNTVKIDDLRVTAFRPSTSTRLEFIVPGLPNVPSGGRNVLISVQNTNGGPAQRLYRITPAIAVVGDPPKIKAIVRADGAPGLLKAGDDALILGENFAQDEIQNVITMRFAVVGRGTFETPVIVTQSSPKQLLVTIPPMVEVINKTKVEVNVELRVGAHVPDVFTVQVEAGFLEDI